MIINFLSIHTFYIRPKCLLISSSVHTVVEQIVSSMQIIRLKKMGFFSFPSDENEWPFSPENLLLSLRMIVRFWLSLPVTIFLRLSILFYLDFLFPARSLLAFLAFLPLVAVVSPLKRKRREERKEERIHRRFVATKVMKNRRVLETLFLQNEGK